jgi:hypothetical protein
MILTAFDCRATCLQYSTSLMKFSSTLSKENLDMRDSLAERSEFELPVPLSKLSDNSLMLSFATSRRVCEALPPWTALWRASGLSLKRTVPNWIALSGRSSRGVAHVARGKRFP